MTAQFAVTILRVAFLIGVIAVTACKERLPAEDFQTIDAWLTCDECIDGERDAVKALGQRAVAVLARALEEGPPQDRLQVLRQQSLEAYQSAVIAGVSADQYADQLATNYTSTYQKRAAIALGDIGGQDARTALDDALMTPKRSTYRDDALQVIRFVRAMFEAVPFPGTVVTPVVSFGDTVELQAAAGQTFSGSEVVTIDENLFPGNIVYFREPGRIGLAAVGSAGSHAITLTDSGSLGGTRVAAFTISSLADHNDRRMLSCLTFACEDSAAPRVVPADLPYRTFITLSPSPPRPDTVDVFQFVAPLPPSALMSLEAELMWEGGADLDLTWQRCGPAPIMSGPLIVGNRDGATAGHPERTLVSIPGGECWLLLVSLRAGTTGPVFAQLRVIAP